MPVRLRMVKNSRQASEHQTTSTTADVELGPELAGVAVEEALHADRRRR